MREELRYIICHDVTFHPRDNIIWWYLHICSQICADMKTLVRHYSAEKNVKPLKCIIANISISASAPTIKCWSDSIVNSSETNRTEASTVPRTSAVNPKATWRKDSGFRLSLNLPFRQRISWVESSQNLEPVQGHNRLKPCSSFVTVAVRLSVSLPSGAGCTRSLDSQKETSSPVPQLRKLGNQLSLHDPIRTIPWTVEKHPSLSYQTVT